MHSRIAVAIVVGALASGGAFAQSASAPAGMGHASEEMHRSMMSGMQGMQSMKPTGDTDRDFATMMKMHHQQAVDMAKAELRHGKSKELKALAQKVVRDQQKEITQLEKWLAANK